VIIKKIRAFQELCNHSLTGDRRREDNDHPLPSLPEIFYLFGEKAWKYGMSWKIYDYHRANLI